jgi:putative intracellular protease/amidase
MVLLSHDTLGDTANKTGFWLGEFATPYYVLKNAAADITMALPKGGQPPIDSSGDSADAQTDDIRRFKEGSKAQSISQIR